MLLTCCLVMIHTAVAQNRYGDMVLEKNSTQNIEAKFVQLLQLDLYYLHYGVYFDAYGGATGTYNDATVHAVKAFQKDHGLVESGVVGGEVALEILKALAKSELGNEWIHFNPMRYDGRKLKKGDRDEGKQNVVALLQRDLNELGFETIDPPGQFDESTEMALKSFQIEALVPSTKIVDESTVTALAHNICLHIGRKKEVKKK